MPEPDAADHAVAEVDQPQLVGADRRARRSGSRRPEDRGDDIAARGPLRSTQVPSTAADRPSITIAIEKITPIAVRLVSKWATSAFLYTLVA